MRNVVLVGFILTNILTWQGTNSAAEPINAGDSPQCRLTMFLAIECLSSGALSYASGTGKLFFPRSLTEVDRRLTCPCSKRRQQYVYLVSRDRQSIFLCCPVALKEAKIDPRKTFVVFADGFKRARGNLRLEFPFALDEIHIADFLGFKFAGKFACKPFGEYKVLAVKNGESFITVVLNPSPMFLELSKSYRLDDKNFSLSGAEVKQIVEQNDVIEPSVLAELKKHSK